MFGMIRSCDSGDLSQGAWDCSGVVLRARVCLQSKRDCLTYGIECPLIKEDCMPFNRSTENCLLSSGNYSRTEEDCLMVKADCSEHTIDCSQKEVVTPKNHNCSSGYSTIWL